MDVTVADLGVVVDTEDAIEYPDVNAIGSHSVNANGLRQSKKLIV